MKVRVGVGLGIAAGAGMDADGFFAIVDACEQQRWDSIWFSERIGGGLLDPMAAMAAVAGRTDRLKFGPSVQVLPGRNPVLLAKELASIDVLSRGRLVAAFGLGSDVPGEHEIFGVERRERAGRTDEATLLIKRLWTEDEVTHEGRYYSVRDLTLGPRPVQQPRPDIWFGGHSDAACRRVGRVGDGWLPSFIAPAEYKAKADIVRATAEANDREVEEEHYGALVPYMASEEGAETVLDLVARRRPEVDPREVIAVGGDDVLRERLESFIDVGASKFVILPVLPPADWVEELARLRATVADPLEN